MSGIKHDQNKAPLDLLPYESLEEVAKVLAFGAKKYSRGNWAKGINYSRLISAAQRHLGQFNSGEDVDDESQLPHLAHAACCILFLLYMHKKRPDMDDRWVKELLQTSSHTKEHKSEALTEVSLKIGRRYKRRDGSCTTIVSGRDYINGDDAEYPFLSEDGYSYTQNGEYLIGIDNNLDIVEKLPF